MQTEINSSLECVVQGADILGEVPLWCERTRQLWWVDVRRPAVQSYDPATGAHRAWRLAPEMVTGSIALRESGGLVLATVGTVVVASLADVQHHRKPLGVVGMTIFLVALCWWIFIKQLDIRVAVWPQF